MNTGRMKPVVSVVLGSYNRLPFLKAALARVRREMKELPHEIIVVDGGSTDGALKWLPLQKDIVTIIQHNRGEWHGHPIERRSWGYFMNLAFKCAQGKYILMTSDDSLLTPGSARKGLQHFESLTAEGRKVGAVAFYFRQWPPQEHYYVLQAFGKCTNVNEGLFLREALAEVGWIEEDRYQFYCADTDLALKLWDAGYEVADCPEAFVEHFLHATAEVRRTNEALFEADQAALMSRWGHIGIPTGAYPFERGRTVEWTDPDRTVLFFPWKARAGIWVRKQRAGISWVGRFLYYGVRSRLRWALGKKA